MRHLKQSLTARFADKFALYEKSVQTPDLDARFLANRYRKLTGRPLRILREDFCGTAQLLFEFVKLHGENRGIGIDLDPAPLEWSRQNGGVGLRESQRSRITLLQQNVLSARSPADVITAFNFSYATFQTRKLLLRYFKAVYLCLHKNGLFMVDAAGGREVPEVEKQAWRVGNYKYEWEVKSFHPVTGRIVCAIHFLFRDGTRLNNAFIYDWRLWTLPELQELMREAGFVDVHVLWECTDLASNLGNGAMRRTAEGKYQGSWYAIVVGKKG